MLSPDQFRDHQPVYTQPKMLLPQSYLDYKRERAENPLLNRGIESQDPT